MEDMISNNRNLLIIGKSNIIKLDIVTKQNLNIINMPISI